MDDSLEIIIYLVLGAAALAGNLYKSYNKKKQEEKRRKSYNNPEEDTPAEQPQMFPSIEDLLGIPKEQTTPSPEYYNDEPVDEESLEEEEILNPVAEEGKAVFQKTEDELVTDDLLLNDDFRISDFVAEDINAIYDNEIKDLKDSESILSDFDPKKAVIYSEILKRTEY